MFNQEYLSIKDKLLLEMSLEEFNNWKYIDQYGNMSTEIQFTSDLRRELEKVERYDLLINLRDSIQKNHNQMVEIRYILNISYIYNNCPL